MRQTHEATVLLGDKSVHRRSRITERRPRLFGDLERERGAIKLQIATPQRLPGCPIVGLYRSDDHVDAHAHLPSWLVDVSCWRRYLLATFLIMPVPEHRPNRRGFVL
jgi:hypothetical protein